MKAIAMIGTGPQVTLLERSLRTVLPYAARHGYDVVIGEGTPPDERATAWAKVPFLRRLLDSYELVLWLDADTMILDSSKDIAAEFDANAFQALVAHKYADGPPEFKGSLQHWLVGRSVEVRRRPRLGSSIRESSLGGC